MRNKEKILSLLQDTIIFKCFWVHYEFVTPYGEEGGKVNRYFLNETDKDENLLFYLKKISHEGKLDKFSDLPNIETIDELLELFKESHFKCYTKDEEIGWDIQEMYLDVTLKYNGKTCFEEKEWAPLRGQDFYEEPSDPTNFISYKELDELYLKEYKISKTKIRSFYASLLTLKG